MSNLLTVTRMPPGRTAISTGAVGFLEFGVSEETAPYLVTTSKAAIWVSKLHEGNLVKAAIRANCTPDQFFAEAVEAIHEAGQHLNWGSVHPLTLDGLKAAINHVLYYDMGEVELLTPQEPLFDVGALSPLDVPQRPSSWLSGDLVVVVPKNREFVGGCWRVNNTDIIGLVHNAARGVAIASGRLLKDEDELAASSTGGDEPDGGP